MQLYSVPSLICVGNDRANGELCLKNRWYDEFGIECAFLNRGCVSRFIDNRESMIIQDRTLAKLGGGIASPPG